MAAEMVDLMSALGHERFAVAGHDRGARVAYRLALDHPDRVSQVAVLNTVPTIKQFERMGAGASLHDADDREAGRRITAPLLLVTGEDEAQLADAPAIWRAWAQDVTAVEVPGGHFVPEEAPREVVCALMAFLASGRV